MMIPGILFLLVFSYIPMVGVITAFQDYIPAKGLFGSEFVGLKHFIYMFKLPDIAQVVSNTLVIALGKILLGTLMAIIFSVLLNEIRIKTIKKSVQTIVYLPHFLSWVVLASVVVNMFSLDGIVNQILAFFGVQHINFLGSNTWFQPLIIGTDVWKEFGYSSIVYLAAITSIDPGLYEAAGMDGASWWRKVWHITLPGMLPIILLMGVMSLTNILSAGFDQIYNLYNPIVYESGDILDTYVYRIGLVGRQYSFGTAVGLFKSVIGIILLLSANQLAKKYTDRKIF
ncbi:ABC transporter permease subunit [Paenibacillus silvae]|nr:ABC transporter permease subunit [Paenibacillus silvae]MCK6073276.1 ABC transporter permease subunit [Paenibacillus silvae]MCK6149248.1 ABC transporter permease subunit [Paenibacillus silvae]MCK6267547.1 ABC transporter permease subunit [Paenibacillus silvae]